MPQGPHIPVSRPFFGLALVILLACLCGLSIAKTDPVPLDPAADQVPYGPGSSWIVGHQLFTEGNFKDALPFLHAAYRAGPQVPVIALEFEEALLGQGYFDDALGVLNFLVGEFPDSTRFRFKRAKLEARLGKVQPALDDLGYLQSQPGVSAEVVSLHASILSSAGRVDEALAILRKGLDLFPERGVAIYLGMTSVLAQNDREAEVPQVLLEALAKFPASPTLYLEQIRTLATLNRHEEALAVAVSADRKFHLPRLQNSREGASRLDSLVAIDKNGDSVPGSFQVELADYYSQHDDLSRSLDILQDLATAGELELEPSLWLARMLLGNDQMPAGIQLVDKVLARWPDSGRGWFLKGKIAEVAEDPTAALAAFQKAADLAPYDPEIRLSLVRHMLVQANGTMRSSVVDSTDQAFHKEFEHQVSVATTLVPDKDRGGQLVLGFASRLLDQPEVAAWHFQLAAEDPDLRMNALLQASLSWDEAGNISKARNILEKLRKENPNNPEIANSLGYFLVEKNRELEEAQRLIDEALATDPSNGAYLDSMGWLKFRQGEIDQALDYLVRAVNAIPDDPIILEHLGVVLANQNRSAEAKDLYRRALLLGGDQVRLQGRLHDLDEN